MNCRRADQLFSAAWEDELSVAEREGLEAHIESCAACRASYDGFVRVQETVQGLPRIEAASDFTDGVWARIHAAEAAPRRVFAAQPSGGWLVASFRPALAAAAGLAVVFAVVAYVNRQPSPVSQTPVIAQADKPSPAPVVIPEAAPSRPQSSPSAGLEERAVAQLQKKEAEPAVTMERVASGGAIRGQRSTSPFIDGRTLIAPEQNLDVTQGAGQRALAIAATPGDTAAGLDSLFNHDYDVEFALDPVHLKRVPGQKRLTPARPAPTEEVGKRASVTF